MSNSIFFERVEWLGPNEANTSRKSDKFYEVEVTVSGAQYVETRRWGRYGAKGQTKVVTHYYKESAVRSAKEQIRAKLDKGYTRPVAPLVRLASVADED